MGRSTKSPGRLSTVPLPSLPAIWSIWWNLIYWRRSKSDICRSCHHYWFLSKQRLDKSWCLQGTPASHSWIHVFQKIVGMTCYHSLKHKSNNQHISTASNTEQEPVVYLKGVSKAESMNWSFKTCYLLPMLTKPYSWILDNRDRQWMIASPLQEYIIHGK